MIVINIPVSPVLRRSIAEPAEIFFSGRITVIRLGSAEELNPVKSRFSNAFRISRQILPNLLLHKNIIIEAGISVEDRHEPGYLCTMRDMVRRIPWGWETLSIIICSGATQVKEPAIRL